LRLVALTSPGNGTDAGSCSPAGQADGTFRIDPPVTFGPDNLMGKGNDLTFKDGGSSSWKDLDLASRATDEKIIPLLLNGKPQVGRGYIERDEAPSASCNYRYLARGIAVHEHIPLYLRRCRKREEAKHNNGSKNGIQNPRSLPSKHLSPTLCTPRCRRRSADPFLSR